MYNETRGLVNSTVRCIMKILLIALLFTTLSTATASLLQEAELLKKEIDALISLQEYEKAAQYLAKKESTHISSGYRILSVFIRQNHNLQNRYELSATYLKKGCDTGDFLSCTQYAGHLAKSGKYKEAESLYIKTATEHSDPHAAGSLVSLYLNRKWEGYSKEKAEYWRFKIPELSKNASNK